MDFKKHKLKAWIILLLPLVLFAAVTFALKLFLVWPPFDIPAHIIGGATVAAIGFLIYDKRAGIVIPGTFVVLMLWEGFEMAGWRLFPFWNNCAYLFCDQDIFFWDGFWDVIIGMGAALLFMLILLKWNTQKRKR